MICPKCGSAIPLYLKSCPNCNHEPIEKKDSIDSNLDSKLEGFKGVLAFVGLGMIVAPFLQAYNLHEELRATASFDLQMVLRLPLMLFYLLQFAICQNYSFVKRNFSRNFMLR